MALISCPECGGKVSDTCDSCPHCGYKLKANSSIKEVSYDKPIVLASRCRHGQGTGSGIFLIIFGLFLCIAIVGIFLVIIGIVSLSDSKTNNQNMHECAYYDVAKRKIILYSYTGNQFIVNPEDIVNVSHPARTENMYVRIRTTGKDRKIDCGNCSREGSVQFKRYVQEICAGTFDPSLINSYQL